MEFPITPPAFILSSLSMLGNGLSMCAREEHFLEKVRKVGSRLRTARCSVAIGARNNNESV